MQVHEMNEKLWETAIYWVNNNPHIKTHVKNKHYIMYSPYEVEDFIAEAYSIAYETLLSHFDNFERVFWTRYKIRCNALANAPHGNYFVELTSVSIAHNVDYIKSIDENAYAHVISQALNLLTPSQKQLCRVIAFSIKPVSIEFLAKAFRTSPSAISQRISAIVNKINAHKERHGAFYEHGNDIL